jgi:hypothetical protein
VAGFCNTQVLRARISPLSEAEERTTRLKRMFSPVALFIFSFALYVSNLEIWMGVKQPLIPDVGTYLFDNVQIQIKSLAGWILPGNVSVGSIATRAQ